MLGILFAAAAIISALFTGPYPALIAVTVISTPAALAALIYWSCAGTKDGDIPFMGY